MTPLTKALPSASSIPPTPFIWTPPPASKASKPALNLAIRTSRRSRINRRTVSGSSKSSDAASSSISPNSNQWYGSASGGASDVEEDRNGGLMVFCPSAVGGNLGGGENASFEYSVSVSRIADNDVGWSHGGGTMLALLCLFKSNASQRGILLRCGGRKAGMVP